MKKIPDQDAENHEHVKMSVMHDNGKIEELMTCNELCDVVKEQHEQEASGKMGMFAFCKVLEHQGPTTPGDMRHKGSKHNVKVPWEDGLMTWEPLSAVTAADPVTSAAHAKEHDMLNAPGWKKLQCIARCMKVLQRMTNNSKCAQCCNAIVRKFGVRIPQNS